MKNKYIWILVAFAGLIGLLTVGLGLKPREIPSPLIGKPVPAFDLARLDNEATRLTPKDMLGQVWMLNVWASWCVSCRQEHPELVRLGQQKVLPIVGLNYKEVRGDINLDSDKISPEEENRLARERAHQWLNTHGDPYTLTIMDLDGRVGMDFGVYGVPETYLIDRNGIIRFKWIGPITPEVVSQKILPLVGELNRS